MVEKYTIRIFAITFIIVFVLALLLKVVYVFCGSRAKKNSILLVIKYASAGCNNVTSIPRKK